VVVPVGSGRAPIEVTTFRADGIYEDGRRPNSVRLVTSLEDDLSRRDLTINAMALDEGGQIIDPFGGQADLRAGLLRAVGDPAARIAEDPLRAVRVARFAATLGFRPDPATLTAVAATAGRIGSTVSAERLGSELVRIAGGIQAKSGLSIIATCGLVGDLVRGASAESSRRLLVLLSQPDSLPPSIPGRLALLFLASGSDERSTRSALGRLAIGDDLAAEVAKRIRVVRIEDRGANRPTLLRSLRGLDDSALDDGLALRRVGGRIGLFPRDGGRLARRLFPLRALPRDRAGLAVDGSELIRAGLAAGPSMGRLIEQLWEEVVTGRLPNRRAALLTRATEIAKTR